MIRKTNENYQPSFLQADLLEQLNKNHPLLALAKEIPWDYLEKEFRPLYSIAGRPAKPIRLMCGLLLLKQMNNLSDQAVVTSWVENPYWQLFCGMREFQFDFPCNSSELTYFRKRLGEKGVEKIFAVRVSLFGKKARAEKVIIDTTVQETELRTGAARISPIRPMLRFASKLSIAS